MRRGEIDWQLSDLVERQGGFATTLSFPDRIRLRAIVKRVHMAYFPRELVSDREADRMIDVIAPGTAAYLIRADAGEGNCDGQGSEEDRTKDNDAPEQEDRKKMATTRTSVQEDDERKDRERLRKEQAEITPEKLSRS